MNQIQNFRFIVLQTKNVACAAVVLIALTATLPLAGQDQFNIQIPESSNGFQPPANSFQPPTNNFQSPTADLQPNPDWPSSKATFGSQVQQASHEAESSPPVVSQRKGNSMVASVTSSMSQAATTLSQKMKGMSGSNPTETPATNGSIDFKKMISSLAIVLGGYLGFVWLVRKLNPSANSRLPDQVVQPLGQVSFGPRKNLQLVRLGSKLVLLLDSPEGTQPIGEVSDPAEVDQLMALCGKRSKSSDRLPTNRQTSDPVVASAPPASQPVPVTVDQDRAVMNQRLADILSTLEGMSRRNGNGGAVFEA